MRVWDREIVTEVEFCDRSISDLFFFLFFGVCLLGWNLKMIIYCDLGYYCSVHRDSGFYSFRSALVEMGQSKGHRKVNSMRTQGFIVILIVLWKWKLKVSWPHLIWNVTFLTIFSGTRRVDVPNIIIDITSKWLVLI